MIMFTEVYVPKMFVKIYSLYEDNQGIDSNKIHPRVQRKRMKGGGEKLIHSDI